jgi:membrane-associated phospholipid phosphatase
LALTQLGSASAVLGAVLISYLGGFRQLAWRFLLTGYTAYMLVVLAKLIINRPRPFVLLSGIHERELLVSGNGFPSGHTAVATALALTIAPHLPRHWRWLPLAWIVSVALSRIYLGVHAPLDIVGGFGIGLAVAATLHFFVNTDKKLRKTAL